MTGRPLGEDPRSILKRTLKRKGEGEHNKGN